MFYLSQVHNQIVIVYIFTYILWWRHQMETFSALLAICAGNSPVPVNSPHKGQWRGALMFSLICVWINGWVNNCEAGDLRRYRTHYDVTVICYRRIYLTITVAAAVPATNCVRPSTINSHSADREIRNVSQISGHLLFHILFSLKAHFCHDCIVVVIFAKCGFSV